jgi:hypothetical protein
MHSSVENARVDHQGGRVDFYARSILDEPRHLHGTRRRVVRPDHFTACSVLNLGELVLKPGTGCLIRQKS